MKRTLSYRRVGIVAAVLSTCLLMSCARTRMSPLHRAAIQGNVSRIEECIDKGNSVNAQDAKGNTPLHYAYYHGRKAAVERLIAFGASPTIRNKDGDTPADMQNIAAAEKLVQAGARLLDMEANWTDRRKARVVYDELLEQDRAIVTKAIVRMVLRNQNRLRVLFLAVKLGISGSEERLNDVLQAYGDKAMAEDYLNSGSQVLYDGGRRWANAHGYYIATGMGSHRVAWGRF